METLVLDVQRAANAKWPKSSYEVGTRAGQAALPKPAFDPETGRPPQLMYLLPEYPGENPINWRRNMYGMIGHGVKFFDLFIFATAQEGQHTCDYTDPDAGSYQGIRQALQVACPCSSRLAPCSLLLAPCSCLHIALRVSEATPCLQEIGMMDDLVATGVAQPYAAAALLFSETADIWWGNVAGAAKRSLYIALRHAQVTVDIVSEEDCSAGALNHYTTLFIVEAQVAEEPMTAIAKWVGTGGNLVLTAGAASLNETNSTNLASQALLPGVDRTGGTWTGTRYSRRNATVYYVKEQLPWAETLDTVTPTADGVVGGKLGVFGEKEIVRLHDASDKNKSAAADMGSDDDDATVSTPPGAWIVLATFDGGSPAELRIKAPRAGGNVTLFLYHPGLSYFKPATPRRPVDRNAHIDAFTNFIPTEFVTSVRAREALAATVGGVEARPVVSSEPLVEASLVLAAKGAVITLVNWSENIRELNATPSTRLTVTLATPLPQFKTATLASCGVLSTSECSPGAARLNATAGGASFSVDLAIADAIILR